MTQAGQTYAVIMAGGSGTRFWPLSRKSRPKQLLALGREREPLLLSTIRRVEALVPPERVVIVTSEALVDEVAAIVPDVPRENILGEPSARNTAPCIGWAAAFVRRRDPDAVIVVLPSDHYVAEPDAFARVLATAIGAASDGELVTIGIEPTRPETGFGYIEVGAPTERAGVLRCERFVEKPDAARATEFLVSGRFLWNSGMFVFRGDAILSAIATTLPSVAEALGRFDAAAAAGSETALVRELFGSLPNVSIDTGVMERSGGILVVPGSFGWSDLGSFQASWELADKDEDGNAAPEGTVLHESRGNFVRATSGKLVALVGVEDLVVIETPEAILVVPRRRDQDVKRVVEALAARRDPRL